MSLKNEGKYRDSLKKSIDWMLTQINPDGSVNPVSKGAIAYYKIPWALILTGKVEEAESVINWIVREAMTSEGDLKSDKRQKFHLDYYTYPNGWVCLASHLLSLFDISYPLWSYISSFQDPHTGGYCSRAPYRKNKNNLQDAISTAWCSFVGLHLGKVEEAIKAAEFLKRLYELQPHFQDTFYYYFYPQKGLLMEKPPEEPDERFIRIKATEGVENWLYILGATIAFLSKLYLITGNKEHLALAKAYFDFISRCHPILYTTESCGKLCFASIHLYRASGVKKYLAAAEDFMCALLKISHPHGYWIRGGKPTISSTAEFCVWRVNLLMLGNNTRRGKCWK